MCSMASVKITVTLPEDQVARIREQVETGYSSCVSGFVQHAVTVALDEQQAWAAALAEGLERTGGPLTDAEREWADAVLGTGGSGHTRAARDQPGSAA